MKKRRGFTLIEILIVVIILAILAAMVLPRFLRQTENAYIAEAQQQLGVLRNANVTALDQGLALPVLNASDTIANMSTLGLQGIPNTNFTYTCTSNGAACTASRTGAASNTIALSLTGVYTCAGGYTLISAGKGCKPAS